MREKVQIKNQRYTKYNHGINRGSNRGQTEPNMVTREAYSWQ